MIKTKEINADKNLIREISREEGLSERFIKILFGRGYDTREKIRDFLEPSLAKLYDPFSFANMREAVERIKAARDCGETVVVYGDYDADGISAVSVLYKSLKIYGIEEVYAVIPEREDGYGLSETVLENALENYCPDLIITVDCGVSAVKEVEYLLDLGVDVIITDHHEAPEILPECLVMDCKIKGSYPFDGLCGAGVAYKLSYALIGEKANAFLDVVAIATIADAMNLVDENRIIVSEGIKLMKKGKCRYCVKALIESSNMKEFTAGSIAFSIAPRINAAGRMGDAYSALSAFLSEDPAEIDELCKKLGEYNAMRQAECEKAFAEADKLIEGKDPKSRAIVLASEEWKSGILGIVAAKLAEKYYKPTIIFSEKNGYYHGSARSVESINIYEALSAVKDKVEEFGGHSQAAGVTIRKDALADFESALNDYLAEHSEITLKDAAIEVDEVIDGQFPIEFASELALLEPCGVGNKKPLFAVECKSASASPLKYGSPHVSLKTKYMDLIWFGGYEYLPMLNAAVEKQIIFEPSISYFNGNRYLRGIVKDVCTVATPSEYLKEVLLETQIDSLKGEEGNYEVIDTERAVRFIETAKKEAYGTLFVLSDPDNLKYYGDLGDFDFGVLEPNKRGNLSCVCLGLKGAAPKEFGRVVYLDEPLRVLKCDGEVFVNCDYKGFDEGKIKADRESLGNIFRRINDRAVSFATVTDLMNEADFGYDKEEVVFAVRVFTELGIIKFINGRYQLDRGFRSSLENSVLFNEMRQRK